jgi:hypothetical protein
MNTHPVSVTVGVAVDRDGIGNIAFHWAVFFSVLQ